MTVKGFKGFNEKFQCVPDGKVFQYKVGEEYTHSGDPELCKSGFHFCENPFDVFGFYSPASSRFAEVEGDGTVRGNTGDEKRSASKLRISTELSLSALCGIGVKFILDKIDFTKAPATNTGYQSAATNTGDYSAATNTGDYSAATNTGYQSAATNTGYQSAATNTGTKSAATNTGYQSAATNTGYQSAATNTGYQSAATNTGYQSAATNTGTKSAATNTGTKSAATNTGYQSAATNTGYQSAATNTGTKSAATNTGKEGYAASVGIEGKAKGSIGCWITVAEWKQDVKTYEWHRIDVKTVRVDGKKIKADTFYQLKKGKFVVAE